MNFCRNIIIYILLLSLIFTVSCRWDEDALSIRECEVLYDDARSPAEAAREKGWKKYTIPGTLKIPGRGGREFHFVWIRSSFIIDGDESRYYGLTTGRIRFSDRIFINNRLIGETSPERVNWRPMPRHYVISPGILKNGANQIYIRLGIYGKYYGGILSETVIQGERSFYLTKFIDDFIHEQLPMGIVILFAGAVIVLMIIFTGDRRKKLLIFSVLPLLIHIIYLVIPLLPEKIISYELFFAFKMCLTLVYPVLFILVMQALYGIFLQTYNRIIIPLMLIFAAAIILSRNASFNYMLGVILVSVFLIIIIPISVDIIRRLNSIKNDTFLLYMISIMSSIAGLLIFIEMYLKISESVYSELMAPYIPPVFIIIGTIIVAREMIKRKIEYELLYDQFKRYKGSEISITDTSEEKLKLVIDFIDKNYTFNLSREGLAAVIGMHPNYFSSLFNYYTGKSMNEYINSLRIEEAKKRLKTKDVKVIDIAFSVGFESLATFNRVFKKATDKTPSEFREGLS